MQVNLIVNSDLISQEQIEEMVKNGVDELVKNDERFMTHRVVIDSEHALMIEFGTNGGVKNTSTRKPGNRSKPQNEWSDAAKNIKKWAETRSHGKVTDADTYGIFKHIMEHGIPPQPYIRPAMHTIYARYINGAYNRMTVRDIAEEFKNQMLANLGDNYTLYDGGGNFKDKIRVEIGDTVHTDMDNFMDRVPSNIMDSDLMDLSGSETRARERIAKKGELWHDNM